MRYALCLLLVWPMIAWSQDAGNSGNELKKLAWQVGPTQGRVSTKATIKVPDGYVFLDDKNTRRFPLSWPGIRRRTAAICLRPIP